MEKHMVMKAKAVLLATALGLFLLTATTRAADNELARRSLVGHKAIYVWVVEMDPAVAKDGLTEALIRSDVSSRLRRGGIKVLSKEKWFDAPGNPYLYVNANVLKLKETKEYIYGLRISFKQTVYPMNQAVEILGADTWSVGGRIGITPNLGKIRTSIGDLVDQFVKAYRWANPKH